MALHSLQEISLFTEAKPARPTFKYNHTCLHFVAMVCTVTQKN